MSLEHIFPPSLSATVNLTRLSDDSDAVLRSTTYMGKLLCLDPGETTGWAIFENLELVDCGQIVTKNRGHAFNYVNNLLSYGTAGSSMEVRVVMEDYRMYGWKKDEHTFSKLHTPKLIGAFEAVFGTMQIPYNMQMAVTAKEFATDDLLRHWGFWIKNKRHARDAIRHGVYYLMFNRGKFYQEALTKEGKEK